MDLHQTSIFVSPDVNQANTQPFASSRKQPCRVTGGPPDLLKSELLNSMAPSRDLPSGCLSEKLGKKRSVDISVSDGGGEGTIPTARETGKPSWESFPVTEN